MVVVFFWGGEWFVVVVVFGNNGCILGIWLLLKIKKFCPRPFSALFAASQPHLEALRNDK